MVTLNTHRNSSLVRRRPRARGFTLVEILTVVVILGIASAIIVPQMGSRDDLKVKAGARLLVADLIYAQNMAIAKQKWHYVKFDAANESYRLMDEAGPAGADNTITHPVNKNAYVTQLGPNGGPRVSEIRIKSAVFNGVESTFRPEFTLAFDELGTPFVYSYMQDNTNELLDGTVVLECGVHRMTITVEQYTGEINISQ